MPWSGANLPWNRSAILLQVPSAPGIYVIWRDAVAIYVGETQDLQSRLLEHFKGSNPRITEQQPTTFGFELSHGAARLPRQESLIAELRPLCNQPAS